MALSKVLTIVERDCMTNDTLINNVSEELALGRASAE